MSATTPRIQNPKTKGKGKDKGQPGQKKIYDVFSRALLTKPLYLHMEYVGSSLKENMEKKIKEEYEGKCIKEGYIRPNSVKIVNYSSGLITDDGVHIKFEVIFEAQVCFPVEGMLIECTATSVTKAGIKAEIKKYDPSPVVIFVARDHFHNSAYFSSVKEGDEISIRVIGQRFELNDKRVAVIAELIEPKKRKPILIIE